jgi:hypothetical protein
MIAHNPLDGRRPGSATLAVIGKLDAYALCDQFTSWNEPLK